MVNLRITLLLLTIALLPQCTIYRSPDRKEFESESATFKTQNLVPLGCSANSVRPKADSSRLITIARGESSPDARFLWEYKIANVSVFESDNLKGVYCVYANN
ncbi:MAG: hypothetical protein H7061_09230 [Bdellovibrionaceae bacterium]|nr:hypothetical protein [Bdellovibrio sp.]